MQALIAGIASRRANKSAICRAGFAKKIPVGLVWFQQRIYGRDCINSAPLPPFLLLQPLQTQANFLPAMLAPDLSSGCPLPVLPRFQMFFSINPSLFKGKTTHCSSITALLDPIATGNTPVAAESLSTAH